MSRAVDMREHIRLKRELAQAYAEDGAYHTAARLLQELGRDTLAHALHVDEQLRDLYQENAQPVQENTR
jgi:hypothetical protein